MELKLKIPKQIQQNYSILNYDYAAPFDIFLEEYIDGFIVIDKQTIKIFHQNQLYQEYAIQDFEKFGSKATINGGYIYGIKQQNEVILATSSKKYFTRLANIALGLNIYLQEKFFPTSDANEPFCPKCGRVYPFGLNHCIYCKKKKDSLKRLWGFTKNYRVFMLLQYLFLLLPILFDSINPMVFERIINDYLVPKNTDYKGFAFMILLVAGIYIIKTIFSMLEQYFNPIVAFGIGDNIRVQVYDKIQKLSIASASKKTTGSLITRVSSDTQEVQWFFSWGIPNFIRVILTAVVVFALMLIMDYKLTLLVLIPLPFIYVIKIVTQHIIWPRYDKRWKQLSKTNNVLHDILGGIKVVKSYSQEEKEIQHFKKENKKLKEYDYQAEKTWLMIMPWVWFLVGAGEILIIYVLGNRVIDNPSNLGSLMKWMSYTGMLYGAVVSLTNYAGMFFDFKIRFEKISEILEEDINYDQGTSLHSIEGNVEFKNVRFGYLSYTPVLKNISFSVQKGQMIGIVGYSGSGKTTLVNLLMKLYSPDNGQILIDGIPLEEFDAFEYRKQLGVVIQETFLFSGTILDNIRYGKSDATYEEIIEVAKIARAHDFIIKKPFGYDTKLGNKGAGLSGGEKQRIAIARAILNRPKIFILDEATSSLDTITEKEIQDALNEIVKGKTTFVIAHRLSTLKNADRLIVLNKGEMVEFGTHQELMKKKGYYYELVNAQKLTYQSNNEQATLQD